MALSVIVTSYESSETLKRCLQSLTGQREAAEIVVSDCSRENPALHLQETFPSVRFLHFKEKLIVPRLRWAALPFTSCDVVAATESRCVPSSTWCRDLLAAHEAAADCPAVGGTVACVGGASKFDRALHFCEYGHYAPPMEEGRVNAISGANLSYKRRALEECQDLVDQGEWETLFHQRWVLAGKSLWQCGARVTFQNSMSTADAFRQRWHYGRGYAADRIQKAHWLVRIGLAIATIGLPIVLFARIARDSMSKGQLIEFAQVSGWVLALSIAWSCGEAAGYVGGKPKAAQIF